MTDFYDRDLATDYVCPKCGGQITSHPDCTLSCVECDFISKTNWPHMEMVFKSNLCESCGCNTAIFPLVRCQCEPYGDQEIFKLKCDHYLTEWEWRWKWEKQSTIHAKSQLLRRREQRATARSFRWAKFKAKNIFSLCKCCALNSAEFPFVCCTVHPLNEIQFEDKCSKYCSHEDNETFLSEHFKHWDERKVLWDKADGWEKKRLMERWNK